MRVDYDEKEQEQEQKKVKSKLPKITVHNIIISDASGSMSSGNKYNTSCKSIVNELNILKKDKNVNFKQTFIEFDSSRYVEHLLCQDKYITENINFIGAFGGTPLYNTIGKVIDKLSTIVKENEKVLLKIFTDGEDTDYGRGQWNKHNLSTLIKKMIDVHKWTITFNCTKYDLSEIKKLNIPESNILVHDNTSESIEQISNERINSTIRYSKNVSLGNNVVTNFYKEIN